MYRNDCLSLYCCSVSHLYPTLCDPMNISTPDFSVFHYLPEFAQTHILVEHKEEIRKHHSFSFFEGFLLLLTFCVSLKP